MEAMKITEAKTCSLPSKIKLVLNVVWSYMKEHENIITRRNVLTHEGKV